MLQCATNAGKKEKESGRPNRDRNSKHILGRIFASLGVLLLLCAGLLYLLKVTPVENMGPVELGEKISRNVSDYIEGNSFSLGFARLDCSSVNESLPGEYVVKVSYFFLEYDIPISIIDSTAPMVHFNTENYICAVNEAVDVNFYVESVLDKSDVELRFYNLETDDTISLSDDGKSAVFGEKGVHPITMIATDASGNMSSYYMSVVVDSAPSIMGTLDYYVAVGTPVDDLLSFSAYDEEDGFIDGAVAFNFSDEYLRTPGDYPIDIWANDSVGLKGQASGVIHSLDPLILQDFINTGFLHSDAENVSGVLNPYDSGYILESDCKRAIENIKPAVVNVHYETSRSRVHGSGYIVKITDDEVIVCTNKHVVGSQKKVDISLFDGATVEAVVMGRQTAPDIAFVKINRSDIPEATSQAIRTVHINLGYYESLSSQPRFEMGMYCINQDGSEWLTRYGEIVRKSGVLDEYFVNYDYPVTEVSVKLTPGVSGSAIVDAHGNLLCMATFYWTHNGVNEYYGVSLNDILDFYEETFGERLEYY